MSLAQVGTPTLATLTLTNANTEYSYIFPPGTQFAQVMGRTNTAFRYAFTAGLVATPTDPYHSVAAGGSWDMPEGKALRASLQIFFASGTAGLVLEIEYWN